MIRSLLLIMVLLLAGCGALVPAQTPLQLAQTPGAPLQISAGSILTAQFRLQAPADWRVITSASIDPITLILAAPDNAALIVVSAQQIVRPPRPQTDAPLRILYQARELSETRVYVYAAAPADEWSRFAPLVMALLASIAVR